MITEYAVNNCALYYILPLKIFATFNNHSRLVKTGSNFKCVMSGFFCRHCIWAELLRNYFFPMDIVNHFRRETVKNSLLLEKRTYPRCSAYHWTIKMTKAYQRVSKVMIRNNRKKGLLVTIVDYCPVAIVEKFLLA